MLEGCLNFRDLGEAGAAKGRVYRSDLIHKCTPRDLAVLSDDLRIRTAIDLRTTRESEATGRDHVPAPGCTVLHAPLSEDPVNTSAVAISRSGRRVAEGYAQLLEPGAAAIRAVFECVATPQSLPLVFFCTAGKDRTGVIASLLLANADCSDRSIADDYARSRRCIERLRVASGLSLEERRAIPHEALRPRAATMLEFIRILRARWGSVAGCLLHLGLSQDLLWRAGNALRGRESIPGERPFTRPRPARKTSRRTIDVP
jgi:protein-tyrosine phosphatase